MTPLFDTAYWAMLIAASTLCCSIVLLIAMGRLSGRKAAVAMVTGIALLVLAGRWPSIFIPGWLNPDESMMLAQAMKFETDLVPWRAIDTGTGGPVNSYALLMGHWLGMDFGYPLARITAIMCLIAAMSLSFLTMRRIGGTATAAIAVLPATMFAASATHQDFLHYSSELASLATIALLGFSASGFTRGRVAWSSDIARSIGVGVCAFIVSMAKVQGVPLGAAVAVSAIALTAPNLLTFCRRVGWVIVGGGAATAALILLLWTTGVLQDFRTSFIELPTTYAANPMTYEQTKDFIQGTPEARSFTQSLAWLSVISLLLLPVVFRRVGLREEVLKAACVVMIGLATYVTLSQPGRGFPHYLNYLSIGGLWILFLVLPWRVNDVNAKAATHET